jgi:hypothetical protein
LSGAAVFRPRFLGDGGNDTAATPGGGRVSRGVTNIIGPTAGHCVLPTRQGIGPDQLPRTAREKYHARRGIRPTTTHRTNSRPRHTGPSGTAWPLLLGPTVNDVCSPVLRIDQSHQCRYKGRLLGAAVHRPVVSGTAGQDTAAAPGGRTESRAATNLVGPTAGLCGLPTR